MVLLELDVAAAAAAGQVELLGQRQVHPEMALLVVLLAEEAAEGIILVMLLVAAMEAMVA